MSEQSIDYETRTTRLSVAPRGESIFSDRAWRVEIDTEGHGEYVVVYGKENEKIMIDPDEWALLSKAIDQLVCECKEDR